MREERKQEEEEGWVDGWMDGLSSGRVGVVLFLKMKQEFSRELTEGPEPSLHSANTHAQTINNAENTPDWMKIYCILTHI